MQQSLGRDKGKRSEVYYLLGKYFCHKILFIYSHITFAMVYYFYFLCFGSRRNECNTSFGEIRGRGQESTTYSLRDAVNDDKIIPQALSLYMINLSLYCRDISFVSMYVMRYMMHISQQEYRGILELEYTMNLKGTPLIFWKITMPCSLKKASKLLMIHLPSKQESF